MNDETLSQARPEDDSTALSSSSEESMQTPIGLAAVESEPTVAVAATFTADPITHPLQFWMEQVEISATVVQAPYAQLLQELLNPQSLISSNQRGFNVLLIRLEDWIRDRLDAGTQENLGHLRAIAHDFGRAVELMRARSKTPLLVHFCPASTALSDVYRGAIDEHEHNLVQRLEALPYTHFSTHEHLMRLYPAVAHENPQADRIAHIPYTQEYFAAIATWAARRIVALIKPQYKVIAIDCDNTLWQGVCGEDGAMGVKVTPAHLELQRMLVRQHDAGVLLCICSKNNPADVEAAFSAHPGMPLREEHLISSRINWKPKSENLHSLAEELDLGLDSFILIDDSGLECAEVQANCSGVLTLQVPQTQDALLHFIDHVWAFDRVVVTQDAKQRTTQYRQNRARSKALSEASDLRQFLASLELKVDVAPMQSADLARVAELVQRTNQFNLTTIRRRASEIETLCDTAQLQSLIVRVRDRFGDYGLVGTLLLRSRPDEVDVDTFVLSCRVLGREVEHHIVNELGRMALDSGRSTIVLRYRRTPRNAPAWTFLDKAFSRFRDEARVDPQHAEEVVFRIPSEYALRVRGDSGGAEIDEKAAGDDAASNSRAKTSSNWHETAYRLSRLTELMAQLSRSVAVMPERQGELIAPQTSTEIAIAQVWAKVLGVSQVGLQDDFFELGGDSLLAVQVIANIGSALGLELSIYEFFEAPTVEQIARKLVQSNPSEDGIQALHTSGPAPLSSAQQRLWFIDRLERGSTAYHVPLALRLRGELHLEALQAALNSIVRRHKVLRTVFIEADGEPMQRALPDARLVLDQLDVRGQDDAMVLERLAREVAAPFDLSTGPLVRAALLRLKADDHILLITMHHIVSDGWSLGVLSRELGALYGAYVSGAPNPLPTLPIQYADYATWQQRRLVEPQVQEQLEYWKNHLQGAPGLIDLPTDRPRPATQSYCGANVPVVIGSELTNELKSLARQLNLTLATTLYTAWSIVLMRLSGQQDVVIGMPVAGRRRTELEPLIGFFVNTLAVRVHCEDDLTVRDLLMRVKEIMIGAQAHQDAPFEHVVDVLQPVRSLSYGPIFQVALAFQNTPTYALELPDLVTSAVDVPVQAAQFDLLLTLQESAEGVSGILNYASDLFDDVTIRRWVEHFRSVLNGMTVNPNEKASVIPLLSEHERRQVVEIFNATEIDYPAEKLLHELFEAQVERTPEAVAVECEGRSLTFAELNRHPSQLAQYLRSTRRVYILDRSAQPVPIGVIGEIYLGGAGVGRGYLNRPELTAERFLPDPFGLDSQARMYKTGNLGRWRADGTIEYRGRTEHQVSIGGFRVELGEIETQLARCEQVREVVVIACEDVPGERRLVAYVAPRDSATPLVVETLRTDLKGVLPEHMVPNAFVVVDRLPLTPSGKLDREALPAADLDVCVSQRYEPPQGEVEETLAGIWRALLRVDRVGRHDNFFELGGHSLLIVQMMERLRSTGLTAELRCVFENPTLAALASALTPQAAGFFEVPPNLIPLACNEITPQMLPLVTLEPEDIQRIVQQVAGGAANVQDIYPLAPPQEGILFHHLLTGDGGDAYVLAILLSVSSRTELDQLITALQYVIDRHDALRTAVRWEHLPRPVQVVYRQAPLPVRELALDSGSDPAEQVKEWIKPERQRVDIREAPPMRLQVAQEAPSGQWYVLLQLHHITIDHVTFEILIAEVLAHLKGEAQQLPASVPYRNHVAQLLASARRDDEEAFFRRTFGAVDEPTAPFGLIDVRGDGTQIEEASADVEIALTRSLRTQAQRLGVSAATLFHAAWALVVACTSGRDEVVFGSVLLGRLQGSAGAQGILGLFTNSLPLKLQLHGVTATELVEQTQRELIELVHHEQASLALAQRCSGIVGSGPLFTTLLNYRHTSTDIDALWSSVEGIRVLAIQERTNYPITLSVDDFGEGFKLTAQTDRRIDPRRIVHYLETALQSLVHALERAPQAQALALSILPEPERREVISLFNKTQATYPAQKLIHELFEEQVERTPDVPAVVYEGQPLTYAELNRQANQLARHLRAKGVGPDRLVAICIERSLEMVVGLLGILKAGGAYIPLDPNHPFERLQYMLEDAAPRVLLTSRELKPGLPVTSTEVIEFDHSDVTSYGSQNLPAADVGLTGQNLVYVIYTSGSTGRPKGTAMPHRSMFNLIEWHRQNLPLRQGHRVLQFAALSFDVAFQETFSTLCMGGTLVLLDEWVRKDPRALMYLLSAQSVERLFLPPLMLQSLAECFETADLIPQSLKDVITAGDQLRISPEITELFKQLPGCRLHNHYGPTETHVVTTLTLAGNPDTWPALPTIGKPISNTQIYVLNSKAEPLPIGVAGEIYIAGANVARGYLNRAELSAERLVADPFSASSQLRLYKTGDVGRWRADGTIEYLGRNDDQVKIRGFRIELREIEAQLSNHAQVREAAVVAREDVPGDKRLVAYVTPRDQTDPQAEELRAYLKGVLPEYMLPSAFVILDSLPLTPTGKLNRRALPPPRFDSCVTEQYEAPQGEIEEAVARIWEELLQVEQVGRHDNFFDLGGHSLLAVKALLKVNQSLGCALKVTDMYASPTPQELATRIGGSAIVDELVDLSQEAALDDDIRALPGRPGIPAKAVLLTGATGFVGRFLLAQLLQDADAMIYCLVRAPSQDQGSFALRKLLSKWDLWRDEFEARIVAIPGDLRLPRLGMDEVTYQMLSKKIDSIYHCGVSMNHLETYAMAKPANVGSARELLKLATSQKPKLINYISTLGVFRSHSEATTRVVDETSSIDQERHRSSSGYGASKWVGEKIFMTATERGIPCNIFRVGFVWADTQLGRYDELQRGYRILKSCLLSGRGIKNFRYHSPPTPVDYVARAVVFLGNQQRGGGGIFHISSSNEKIESLFERCNEILGTSLDLLPYYEWVCEIKRLHHEGHSLPIVPLIEGTFSMNEKALYEHERQWLSSHVPFDCSRTRRELENAGIVAPILDDDLLKACIESMLSRDADLRKRIEGSTELMLTRRRVS